MQNFQDSGSWKGKWELQMRLTRRRLQRLMAQNARRQELILRNLEEIKALRALMGLYGEMVERESEEPP